MLLKVILEVSVDRCLSRHPKGFITLSPKKLRAKKFLFKTHRHNQICL